MKKTIVTILFVLSAGIISGCNQNLTQENVALKAENAKLKNQLSICMGKIKSQEIFKYDPSKTNPDDNMSF